MKPIDARRNAGRRPGRSGSTARPSIESHPELGVSMQPRIVRNVVLPEPDGPSRATISPRPSTNEAPLSTGMLCAPSRNTFVMSRASRTFIDPNPFHLASTIDAPKYGSAFSPAEHERGVEHSNLPA